jgi:DNA-binding IclR family transcriptional regulator
LLGIEGQIHMKKDTVKSTVRGQFKSLLRAIDILDILGEKPALSVTQISDLSGLPRSTTYKYLAVMRECGLVDHEESSEKYRLGMKLFELGSSVQNRISIDIIARPYMQELSNEIQEAVALTVSYGNWAVNVQAAEPERGNQMVLLVRKGQRNSLHAGAAGKIHLAYQGDEKIEAFLRTQKLTKYNKNTIVDPDELRKEVKAIRRAGYASSEAEISTGVRALAAPILDQRERIAAALVVYGPVQRIDGQKRERIVKLILEYSKRISDEMRRNPSPIKAGRSL